MLSQFNLHNGHKRSRSSSLPQLQLSQNTSTLVSNYKSVCKQLQQKNQRLGKAYQDLKALFGVLEQRDH